MSVNISIDKLKPHPINKNIYGEESKEIKMLSEQIKKSKMITNLIVNQDNIIISGHRRYYACLILNIKEVPCKKIIFKDENEELERLLIENQYRDKTTEQKAREGQLQEKIERDKAEKRMLSGIHPMDSGPQGSLLLAA